MFDKVNELIKTLEPITDWSMVKKGDKIFNKCSLDVNYIDIFNRIEHWSDNRVVVFYTNYKGESWHGDVEGYWYYVK